MYSYYIENINTKETTIIFGYNERDAFRRAKNLNPADWRVVNCAYED